MADIDWAGMYLNIPLKRLELLLRLPPLYIMDQLLLRELGLTSILGQVLNAGQDEPSATLVATSSFEGQKVQIHSADEETASPALMASLANLSSLNDSESLLNVINGSTFDDLYEHLYGEASSFSSMTYSSVIQALVSLWLSTNAYVLCLFVLMLNCRHLVTFYLYLLAFLTLPASFLSHYVMCDAIGAGRLISQDLAGNLNPENAEWLVHRYLSSLLPFQWGVTFKAIAVNYLTQPVLSYFFCSVAQGHFLRSDQLFQLVTVSMMGPNILAILGLPQEALHLAAICSIVLPLGILCLVTFKMAGNAFHIMRTSLRNKQEFVQNFGIHTFLETEWTRLRVPTLLRTFWLSRLALLISIEAVKLAQNEESQILTDTTILLEQIADLAREMAVRGAETIIAVLGMTSVVSSLCHYLGSFFYVLLNTDDEEEKSVGSVSAMLFFLLSLQTGLTSLEPEKRFARLLKNICLLVTALFHFIHNMVRPVLQNLSATRNMNRARHLRALSICVFLVTAPLLMMTLLWQSLSAGTWLLAVSAFCIEVMVKVFVSVLCYLLFFYDHRWREGTWEGLDDAVYYVKAGGNTVEFCFAVFLFFNGAYILLFESGGTIRAVMMLIHAYCNIWCEAKQGWSAFMKRRTAVTKINNLSDASPEELRAHDDVCAICHMEMEAAKKTRCKHYFHSMCLRKALYHQDYCPLCHTVLFRTRTETSGQEEGQENHQINPDDNNARNAGENANVQRNRRQRQAVINDDANVMADDDAFEEVIDNDANETDESSGEDGEDLSEDDDENVTDDSDDECDAMTPQVRQNVIVRAEGDDEENFINDNLVMDLSDNDNDNSDDEDNVDIPVIIE